MIKNLSKKLFVIALIIFSVLFIDTLKNEPKVTKATYTLAGQTRSSATLNAQQRQRRLINFFKLKARSWNQKLPQNLKLKGKYQDILLLLRFNWDSIINYQDLDLLLPKAKQQFDQIWTGKSSEFAFTTALDELERFFNKLTLFYDFKNGLAKRLAGAGLKTIVSRGKAINVTRLIETNWNIVKTPDDLKPEANEELDSLVADTKHPITKTLIEKRIGSFRNTKFLFEDLTSLVGKSWVEKAKALGIQKLHVNGKLYSIAHLVNFMSDLLAWIYQDNNHQKRTIVLSDEDYLDYQLLKTEKTTNSITEEYFNMIKEGRAGWKAYKELKTLVQNGITFEKIMRATGLYEISLALWDALKPKNDADSSIIADLKRFKIFSLRIKQTVPNAPSLRLWALFHLRLADWKDAKVKKAVLYHVFEKTLDKKSIIAFYHQFHALVKQLDLNDAYSFAHSRPAVSLNLLTQAISSFHQRATKLWQQMKTHLKEINFLKKLYPTISELPEFWYQGKKIVFTRLMTRTKRDWQEIKHYLQMLFFDRMEFDKWVNQKITMQIFLEQYFQKIRVRKLITFLTAWIKTEYHRKRYVSYRVFLKKQWIDFSALVNCWLDATCKSNLQNSNFDYQQLPKNVLDVFKKFIALWIGKTELDQAMARTILFQRLQKNRWIFRLFNDLGINKLNFTRIYKRSLFNDKSFSFQALKQVKWNEIAHFDQLKGKQREEFDALTINFNFNIFLNYVWYLFWQTKWIPEFKTLKFFKTTPWNTYFRTQRYSFIHNAFIFLPRSQFQPRSRDLFSRWMAMLQYNRYDSITPYNFGSYSLVYKAKEYHALLRDNVDPYPFLANFTALRTLFQNSIWNFFRNILIPKLQKSNSTIFVFYYPAYPRPKTVIDFVDLKPLLMIDWSKINTFADLLKQNDNITVVVGAFFRWFYKYVDFGEGKLKLNKLVDWGLNWNYSSGLLSLWKKIVKSDLKRLPAVGLCYIRPEKYIWVGSPKPHLTSHLFNFRLWKALHKQYPNSNLLTLSKIPAIIQKDLKILSIFGIVNEQKIQQFIASCQSKTQEVFQQIKQYMPQIQKRKLNWLFLPLINGSFQRFSITELRKISNWNDLVKFSQLQGDAKKEFERLIVYYGSSPASFWYNFRTMKQFNPFMFLRKYFAVQKAFFQFFKTQLVPTFQKWPMSASIFNRINFVLQTLGSNFVHKHSTQLIETLAKSLPLPSNGNDNWADLTRSWLILVSQDWTAFQHLGQLPENLKAQFEHVWSKWNFLILDPQYSKFFERFGQYLKSIQTKTAELFRHFKESKWQIRLRQLSASNRLVINNKHYSITHLLNTDWNQVGNSWQKLSKAAQNEITHLAFREVSWDQIELYLKNQLAAQFVHSFQNGPLTQLISKSIVNQMYTESGWLINFYKLRVFPWQQIDHYLEMPYATRIEFQTFLLAKWILPNQLAKLLKSYHFFLDLSHFYFSQTLGVLKMWKMDQITMPSGKTYRLTHLIKDATTVAGYDALSSQAKAELQQLLDDGITTANIKERVTAIANTKTSLFWRSFKSNRILMTKFHQKGETKVMINQNTFSLTNLLAVNWAQIDNYRDLSAPAQREIANLVFSDITITDLFTMMYRIILFWEFKRDSTVSVDLLFLRLQEIQIAQRTYQIDALINYDWSMATSYYDLSGKVKKQFDMLVQNDVTEQMLQTYATSFNDQALNILVTLVADNWIKKMKKHKIDSLKIRNTVYRVDAFRSFQEWNTVASFSELPNKTRQQFIQLVLNNVTSLELANAIKRHILLQFFQTSSFIQELDQMKITQLKVNNVFYSLKALQKVEWDKVTTNSGIKNDLAQKELEKLVNDNIDVQTLQAALQRGKLVRNLILITAFQQNNGFLARLKAAGKKELKINGKTVSFAHILQFNWKKIRNNPNPTLPDKVKKEVQNLHVFVDENKMMQTLENNLSLGKRSKPSQFIPYLIKNKATTMSFSWTQIIVILFMVGGNLILIGLFLRQIWFQYGSQ